MSNASINFQPIEVIRNANGSFCHPEIDGLFGEREAVPKEEWQAWLADRGLECERVDFEYDAPEEMSERYFEEGMESFAEWQPTPPEGDGWFILAISDTEDGPMCWFVRRIITKQEQPT